MMTPRFEFAFLCIAVLGMNLGCRAPDHSDMCADGWFCAVGEVCAPNGGCAPETCGDGIVDDAEECDGDDAYYCTDLEGYRMGAARCTDSCKLNTSTCAAFNWTSVQNQLDDTYQLVRIWPWDNGELVIIGRIGDRFQADEDLLLPPGIVVRGTSGSLEPAEPSHGALLGIWGTAAGELVTVGSFQTINVSDGNEWLPIAPASNGHHYVGVWGTSQDDLYVVRTNTCVTDNCEGNNEILHYDGATWDYIELASRQHMFDVWGTSAADIFVVGDSGNVFHYDGRVWSKRDAPGEPARALFGVWGTDDPTQDVFIAGGRGVILRFRRATGRLTLMNTPGLEAINFFDVWGTSPSNVYAVGSGGVIVHYDGNSEDRWDVEPGVTEEVLLGIRGNEHGIFAVGEAGTILRSSGVRLDQADTPAPGAILSVWATGSGETYAVGEQGTVLRNAGDESDWRALDSPTIQHLTRVTGGADGTIAAVGEAATVVTVQGDVVRDIGPAGDVALFDAWVSPSGNIYVVGYEGSFYRFRDGSWERLELPGEYVDVNLFTVWGRADDDIFLGTGGQGILHYDGENVRRAYFAAFLSEVRAIRADAAGGLVAVGMPGYLLRCPSRPGTTASCLSRDDWRREAVTGFNGRFMDVWAAAAADFFAVDPETGVVHFDGSTWSPVDMRLDGEAYRPHGVSGSSDGRQVLIGDMDGTMRRLTRQH